MRGLLMQKTYAAFFFRKFGRFYEKKEASIICINQKTQPWSGKWDEKKFEVREVLQVPIGFPGIDIEPLCILH